VKDTDWRGRDKPKESGWLLLLVVLVVSVVLAVAWVHGWELYRLWRPGHG